MNSNQSKELELKYKSLNRIVNLFIVINISLFVTTGLVSDFKYYFPLIALFIFLLIQFVLTCPWINIFNKKLYLFNFILVWIGIYFSGSSIVYMIQNGHFKEIFM